MWFFPLAAATAEAVPAMTLRFHRALWSMGGCVLALVVLTVVLILLRFRDRRLLRDGLRDLRMSVSHNKESWEILRNVLDSLPAGVSVKSADDNFRYIFWNRELQTHTGLTAEEIIGRSDPEIHPYPGSENHFRDNDIKVRDAVEMLHETEQLTVPSGRNFVYELYKKRLTTQSGRTFILDLRIDETRRFELERERERMVEALNNLVRNEHLVNACLARLTMDIDFDSSIRLILEMIGHSAGADRCYICRYDSAANTMGGCYEYCVPGVNEITPGLKNLRLATLPAYRDLLERKLDLVLPRLDDAPPEWAEEVAFFRTHDTRSVMECGIFTNGQIIGIAGLEFVNTEHDFSASDIHTLHDAANLFVIAHTRQSHINAIADNQTLQKQLIDTIDQPISLIGLDGDLRSGNTAAEKWGDRTAGELKGQKCYERFCHSSDFPDWCPMRQVKRDRQGHQADFTFQDRDYVIKTQPLFDHQERLFAVLETAVDVTELRRRNAQLEEAMRMAQAADRAKSYFLATMSHELRTPLNAVIGFSELLQNRELPEPEQLEYLNAINYSGNALLKLINDILDLTKLDSGQAEVKPEPTDVGLLCTEIQSIFSHKALENGVAFHVNYPRGLPLFELDGLRIRQVLINLVGNAFKFTERGEINLTLREFDRNERTGGLEFVIADTGIGISAAYQEKVFSPFVQDEKLRGTRAAQGTGLGLPIARLWVEKMGGTLQLVSAEGVGSTFTVRLPGLKCAPRDAGSDTIDLESLGFSEDLRILLVDDLPVNLKVLQAMLSKFHCRCDSATSAQAALKLLADRHFDLLLTDMWMPEINGAELARQARLLPGCAALKIIAVTADVEARRFISAEVFDSVLLKPLSLEKLKTQLAAVAGCRTGD